MATGALQASTVVIMGDSLSAGYGLQPGEGWVELLQQRLQQRHPRHAVVNASISGDTSGGGVARLDALLAQHPAGLFLLELGANDGLRGLSLTEMASNLSTIIRRAQGHGSEVILIGVQLPPNYGRRYTDRFYQVLVSLVSRHQIGWVPMLMEGVAIDPALRLPDNLHPNAAAQPLLLENVWRVVEPYLYPR